MNVLILGSGGREHALAWKIAQSSKLTKLYIAPGNPGTAKLGENIDIDIKNFEAITETVLKYAVDMVVVGPEDPLVNGIVDYFNADERLKSVVFIGPSKQGAALEGSKDFAKAFMRKYNIPTASYASFTEGQLEEGYTFLDRMKAPYVLKADGLAAGKGVFILNDLLAAKNMLKEMLRGKFGKASSKVVIEEFICGIEVSVFVLTDGQSYKILPEAKDYKRIGDGDTGLNTGGMGAVSPAPFVTDSFMQKISANIIEPTINGLKQEGIDYKGFLFLGLINVGGNPMVIEYNVRMGDPETEAVLPRLDADMLDLFEGIATGALEQKQCNIHKTTAVSVVCVSGGYPESYEKGFVIEGIDNAKDELVFQAGTLQKGVDIVTSGGRVLVVTALADDIVTAKQKAYNMVSNIKYDKIYYRKDIGNDLAK
ncbi:MAG: phosphoribosylamine--glycine ligase [Prevotellaceae bacterium]|jgi:phosphoribosylamine--glycine ligase|nr:phosphoribosylamine--glycine ligase [Prevotellaceae bacterium]